MMLNKITLSEKVDSWLKSIDTSSLEPSNQNKVPKVLRRQNFEYQCNLESNARSSLPDCIPTDIHS